MHTRTFLNGEWNLLRIVYYNKCWLNRTTSPFEAYPSATVCPYTKGVSLVLSFTIPWYLDPFLYRKNKTKKKKKKEWLSNFWYSHSMKSSTAIKKLKGLPFGSVVRNVSCLCGRHRFDPWSGQIPHTTEQLSLSAPTDTQVPWSLCSATRSQCNEKPAHHNWRVTPACHDQRKAHAAKTQRNQYINK